MKSCARITATSPESIKKAISLVKKIHNDNPGFIHGDYTLSNILETKGGLKVIDWDDYNEKGEQIFDVCSLIIHYLFILNKNDLNKVKEILTSEEVCNWFEKYDDKINKENLLPVWNSFLEYSMEFYKDRRQSKYDFYKKIKSCLL